MDDESNVVPLPGQETSLRVKASPFVWRDPTTIPRRRYLYGFELRRKQLSMLIAPGAAGKTTLKVGRAICMATGRDFFGHRVWDGPHRVWMWNLEDELEEVEKTVHAFLKLWNLTADDLGGRLFLDGSDAVASPLLKLVVEDRTGGIVVQRPIIAALIEEMLARKIDYLDVDPFVSSHSVEENNNPGMDLIAKEWIKVAVATNAAISLAHHVRKPPNGGLGETTSADARGAGSVVAAARSCLVINRMSSVQAEELGIPACDRKRYISVYDDKNNKAPPALKAHWYEFVSVGLGNGDDTGPEDSIGALSVWEAPDAFGGVTVDQLIGIQELIKRRPDDARKHSASGAWVGKLVAFALDLNLDSPSDVARIKLFLRTWIENGALRTRSEYDDKAKRNVEYVEVGNWAKK